MKINLVYFKSSVPGLNNSASVGKGDVESIDFDPESEVVTVTRKIGVVLVPRDNVNSMIPAPIEASVDPEVA